MKKYSKYTVISNQYAVSSKLCRLLKTLLSAYCLLFYCLLSNAQIYPVQVTPQIVPPYSFKLSDYTTTTQEKLFVNLLLTDAQESGRQVRLKLFVEGPGINFQSVDFVSGALPIVLDGGINQRLTNLDLQAYFNLNNLVGISPKQYGEQLPEGQYRFCFEVYDQFSGQRISNRSCANVYLVLNDPPLLNVPFRGDLVTAQNPQNIIFNWTPRHINAPAVQYEFTLKELWDTGMDPQAAFLASPPLYQTTTYATTLHYGPAQTPLLEGKTYGWQVRAFVSDGITSTSLFRNNGLSEIYHFAYRADCKPPRFVLSEAENSQTVKINWQTGEHLRYRVQYRKKGYGEDDWFGLWTRTNEATIRYLEAGTVYEFRVGGDCNPLQTSSEKAGIGLAYSPIHEFTTPTEDEMAYYNCGIPPEIEITNQDPLQQLKPYEVFTAGDFPIVVREASGSNGHFTGWGYITLPFLESIKEIVDVANVVSEGDINIGKFSRIRVEFDNIKINTDYQLVEGMVETSYDPNWSGIVDVDEAIADIGDFVNAIYDTLEEALDALGITNGNYEEQNVNFEIADITVNEGGETIVKGKNGEEQNLGAGNNTVVTDANGTTIVVNENGEIGAISDEELTTRPNVYFKRLQDGLSGEKNIYGYDEVEAGNYDDDHISVENEKVTYCDIKLRGGTNIEDVFLESEDSLSIKAVFENNKLKIQSLFTGDKIEKKIYAKSIVDSTTVATISVNSYKPISINGKIYSLYKQGDNSTKPPNNLNANSIKTDANEYLKYLVINMGTLDVDAEIPVDFDLNGNGKLDFFKNGTNIELDKVWRELVRKGLGFDDIVRVKDYLNRIWVIDSSTVVDQKYIMVPGSATNKGFDLTKVDEYSIQSPTGGSKETINIDSIVGNKVYLKSKLRYAHPKTNDPMTSHIITSKSKTAGLSAKDAKKKINQRPALTCGSVTNTLMAVRISHELMHGKGLRDVNDSKNIMHYTISGQSIDNKKPYRYKELDPVLTGTPTLDSSKPKQNQWNIINRN
nr:fibronectin type III domain-containing protein [uncultured Allomuricauda sp.]